MLGRLTSKPFDEKILHEVVDKSTLSPPPDTANSDTIKKGLGGIPLVFEGDKEFEGGIVIPVLEDNPVSAGLGVDIGGDEVPTRFIHAPKELAKYPHLMSLPVRGDSMNPTLNDGDMVVCDGGGWDGDGVYVIKTIEETFVKRVQHTADGFRIISDNKMYESYTESAERVAIVGKVRAAVVMGP
jgi:phage repressor protein C with HTH and peptisase S24 domain